MNGEDGGGALTLEREGQCGCVIVARRRESVGWQWCLRIWICEVSGRCFLFEVGSERFGCFLGGWKWTRREAPDYVGG